MNFSRRAFFQEGVRATRVLEKKKKRAGQKKNSEQTQEQEKLAGLNVRVIDLQGKLIGGREMWENWGRQIFVGRDEPR